MKHYSLKNILQQNALYNVIFGERSNGKTFAVLELALFGYHKDGIDINGYLDDGTQLGIIRRWDEDFKGNNGHKMFDNFISNEEQGNIIEKRTKGKYNYVYYYSGKWFLQKIDENGEVVAKDENPFAYAFSLTAEEHYKSTSYPQIKIILFDEFLTRKYYLPDEFIKFTSVLSTIIRLRDDVRIFMCGNTVNKYCPYFAEMGLKNVKNMQRGKIDVYNYGESGLIVAVEYSDFPAKTKASNKYFAFNNPKLQMVTNGIWEMNIYPHLPVKYCNADILYKYYIVFDNELLQCEIIDRDDLLFTYIHRKTTPIKDDDAIIYQQGYDARPNYCRKINHPHSVIENKIADFFIKEKVFYQDNEVGEIVRNYLVWCKTGE